MLQGINCAATTASIRAERGTAAAVAPTQASLSATEPQSIISRAVIEDSTPPTGNFNTINAESKAALRGWKKLPFVGGA